MKLLLKAIRDELIGDAALIASVPAADITTSYNMEVANFPCIVLGISSGTGSVGISGLDSAAIVIEIYSEISKQKAWEIHALVNGLLDNKEQEISTADRKIHSIHEKTARADQFDFRTNTWKITTQYDIIYSTSSVISTTAANGIIYADASDVTAVSGKEIAKFGGRISLDVSFEKEIQTESERFGKSVYFHNGTAIITIEDVLFKAASIYKLWDIGYSASGTLADDSTAATTYTVAQSSIPRYLQFLFQCTKTDDGKKLEIEADRAICERLLVPLSKDEISTHMVKWLCLGASSDHIARVAIEN